MKRGIIRIVTGIVMILLQLISIAGQQSSNSSVTNSNLAFYIGLYSVGITGVILLIFGIRAYSKGLYSQNVLHRKGKKISSIVKWTSFSISALLVLYYLIYIVVNIKDISISTWLMFIGTSFFFTYSLFYMYKKPSCLFSGSLIFIGSAYLYGLLSNLTWYIFYLSDLDNYPAYVMMELIPCLIAGILYIVIATMIYKEKFSIRVVKVLGYIAFAMEITSRILSDIILFHGVAFYDIGALLFTIFTIAIMFYISILDINSLQNEPYIMSTNPYRRETMSCATASESNPPRYKCEMCDHLCEKVTYSKIVDDMGIRYRNLCNACVEIYNAVPEIKQTSEAPSNETTEVTAEILFCRKCGEKLNLDSRFCHKCGAEIIKE